MLIAFLLCASYLLSVGQLLLVCLSSFSDEKTHAYREVKS